MTMNRRNVLIGLGAITAGGGAVLGSGAFSQVEAERTVDLNTSGDSGALLQFADGGSELVGTEDVDNDAIIKLDAQNLNQNALTRADGAIEVTNTGQNDVGFYVNGVGDVLDFEVNNETIVGSSNAIDIGSGSGTAVIDVVVDLRGDTVGASDITKQVTFVADTAAHSGA